MSTNKGLSAATWRQVTPSDRLQVYHDLEVKGLCLYVRPSGQKTYRLRCQHNGHRLDKTIGEATDITLHDARRLATEARAVAQKLDARLGRKKSPTLGEVAEAYRTTPEFNALAINTRSYYASYLDRYLLPALGDKPIDEISRPEIKKLFRDATGPSKDRFAVAEAVRQTTIRVFSHAVEEEIIPVNIAATIKRLAYPRERDRVLSREEIRTLWTSTDDEAVHRDVRDIVRLCLLTAGRRTEVAMMSWHEVDMEARLWTIPAGRAKTRRKYETPLSRPAFEILQRRHAERAGSGRVFGVRPDTITAALRRISSKADRNAHFTPHDLRRTAITTMIRDLHIGKEVAERILNHTQPTRGALRHYAHYSYLQEKSEALSAWGTHVVSIISSPQDLASAQQCQ